MKTIKQWQEAIHAYAREKGWWDQKVVGGEVIPRSIGDLFTNVHSEVSEAWEEYRNGREMNEIYYGPEPPEMTSGGKPEGVPIELADAVIRIMDICEAYRIDLEEAIRIKHEYNKTRPHRHGGKRS